MKNYYYIFIFSLFIISFTKDNLPDKIQVALKTKEFILSQLRYDYLMTNYICNMTPNMSYNIIIDERVCGDTKLFFYSSSCLNGKDTITELFEAGKKFTYFKPMDTLGFKISWPDSVAKSDLFSYMNSSNDTSFFVKLKIPAESDERYWHEVVLVNRINPQTLQYILVYNKKDLELVHVFRRFELDSSLSPVKFCNAKENIIYNEYEFPNKIWMFGKLDDY